MTNFILTTMHTLVNHDHSLVGFCWLLAVIMLSCPFLYRDAPLIKNKTKKKPKRKKATASDLKHESKA